MGSLSLSVFEIFFLFICAIVVGGVIHFFISSRRNFNRMIRESQKPKNSFDEWKLKYLNDMELKEKEMAGLKNQLAEAEENSRIYMMEVEEQQLKVKKLRTELEAAKAEKPVEAVYTEPKADYYAQLRLAQQSLIEHNEKIKQLLEQVDVIKESEEKNLEIQRDNDELNTRINDLKQILNEKESEISQIKQKENLSKEMSSMLDNAYGEFNVLQGKILKLESQLSASKMTSIEHEDLKESYYKMTRDLNEAKSKLSHYMQENHNLQIQLNRTEDKLSEANLQRQQLQKKVAYLEELTSDLQMMSEANKKLEVQLKKIGELESMLNLVSEERDQLKEKQQPGL
jgi:DNA repair exonuclease SbcCD ATPase subunit